MFKYFDSSRVGFIFYGGFDYFKIYFRWSFEGEIFGFFVCYDGEVERLEKISFL